MASQNSMLFTHLELAKVSFTTILLFLFLTVASLNAATAPSPFSIVNSSQDVSITKTSTPPALPDSLSPPRLTSVNEYPVNVIHSFTGLPLDSNGWTDFTAMTREGYEDARVIFVSSSTGSDSTGQIYGIENITFDENGMFQAVGSINAFSSLAIAYSQVRNGYPDILLLKRGDSWTTGLGTYVKSGENQTLRHIIASYGSGNKPRLTDNEFNSYNADYVIVANLHFYSADWLSSDRAMDIRGTATHQLWEDLTIENKQGDIIQGGTINDIALRRNVWIHGEAHDGQLYAQQATRILLEECIFYEPYDDSFPDNSRFGRHLYFTSEGTAGPEYHDYLNDVTIRRNIFYGADRGSVDYRSGGILDNNLFLANNGSTIGGVGGSSGTVQSATVTNNVLMEGSPRIGEGNSLLLRNIDGGLVFNNIWTDNTNVGNYVPALSFAGDDVSLFIAKNITIKNNINYGMTGALEPYALSFSGEFTEVENVKVEDNEFQLVNGGTIIIHRYWDSGTKRFEGYSFSGNKYYSTISENSWLRSGSRMNYIDWVTVSGETGSSTGIISYTDPTRNVKTYNQTLGGTASTEEFMTQAILQSRQHWRLAYTACAANNYIREGFDKESINCSY